MNGVIVAFLLCAGLAFLCLCRLVSKPDGRELGAWVELWFLLLAAANLVALALLFSSAAR